MASSGPVIFSGITVIPLVNYPVILNGISRSHSAGLVGHFERDYACLPKAKRQRRAELPPKSRTRDIFSSPPIINPGFRLSFDQQ